MMKYVIDLQNVSKSFQDHTKQVRIYEDLSWSVQEGGYVAIMGRSGSGKTTLLHMLAGIDASYTGRLWVQGKPLHSMTTSQRTQFRSQHISFIFQDFHLLPHLTVQENIDIMIHMNKRPRVFSTSDIIARVGLQGRENEYVSVLSGGEQQRVAVARAFVSKTDVLLADEPTGNLDEDNAQIVMDIMTQLQETTEVAIIMITHDSHIASYAKSQYTLVNHSLVCTSPTSV